MGKRNHKLISTLIITILLLQSSIALLAVTVPVGTLIQLELSNTISSANSYAGQKVNFTVLNDVKVANELVVMAGSKATGKIISVDDSGIIGKPGSLSIQLTRVTAIDGSIIPISANSVLKGEDKSGTAIVVTLILCFLGLFIEGGDAVLQAGSVIEADVISAAEVDADNIVSQTANIPAIIELVKGSRLEITTTSGKLLIGNLESKEKDEISIFDLKTLYRIKANKISSAIDSSGNNVTELLSNSADFESTTKYKWNSIAVERIY